EHAAGWIQGTEYYTLEYLSFFFAAKTLMKKLKIILGILVVVSPAGLAQIQNPVNVLPNGATATTQAVGDNSTKLATTAYVDQNQNAPAWARWLGDGSEGAGNCSGTLTAGEHWYTTFTVSGG